MTDIGIAVRAILEVRTETARRTGCTEWGGEGVRSALIEAGGSLGGALAAGALAAEDASLVKPSARAFRNHWPVNASEPPRQKYSQPCPTHPDQSEPCPTCGQERPDPEITRAGIEKVRAAMAAAGITRIPKTEECIDDSDICEDCGRRHAGTCSTEETDQ